MAKQSSRATVADTAFTRRGALALGFAAVPLLHSAGCKRTAAASDRPPADYVGSYELVDLGVGDGNWSIARRINDRGDILFSWGHAKFPDNDLVTDGGSGVWSDRGVIDLGSFGMTFAIDIDDAGVVFGGDADGRRLLYHPGRSQAEPYDAFGDRGYPSAMGSTGVVVGTHGKDGVVASPDGLLLLPVPDGYGHVTPVAVNAAGDVAGFTWETPGAMSGHRAVLIRDGEATALKPAPGADTSEASDINAHGQVVGHAGRFGVKLVRGQGRAFRYDARTGQMLDLGTLPGYQSSAAEAVNDSGMVVGLTYGRLDDAVAEPFAKAFRHHPQVGVIEDLNLQVDLPVGWVLAEAYDINNRGEIVGRARVLGQSRAFLLRSRTR